MKKMSPETFVKEYGDVVVAYKKLTLLLGEEKARRKVDKILVKYDTH